MEKIQRRIKKLEDKQKPEEAVDLLACGYNFNSKKDHGIPCIITDPSRPLWGCVFFAKISLKEFVKKYGDPIDFNQS